jgi:hypothetical protein
MCKYDKILKDSSVFDGTRMEFRFVYGVSGGEAHTKCLNFGRYPFGLLICRVSERGS